ncbi:MAG: AAA family ATPase, partial [Woeseia sp.]
MNQRASFSRRGRVMGGATAYNGLDAFQPILYCYRQIKSAKGSFMRHIMVLNAKGGCGKSTLATNVAGYYATQGKAVALADYDPQGSALDWLELRPADRPEIQTLRGFETGLKGVSRGTDVVVIDAPARSHGKELTELLTHAETIL